MKENLESASTSKDLIIEEDYEYEDMDYDSDSNTGNLVISNDLNKVTTANNSQSSSAINNMKNAGRKKSNQVQ